MPPKKKVAAPIDRPLSRAYLREFTGWSTAYPPGLSDPTSLRIMENLMIERDGAVSIRPGLRRLSWLERPDGSGSSITGSRSPEAAVSSLEPFYLNDGSQAYLYAVREADLSVGFRVLTDALDSSRSVWPLTQAGIDFEVDDGLAFTQGTTYVRFLQIDNKIFALSDAGETMRQFKVGATKTARVLRGVPRPEWSVADKLTVVHPDTSWQGGRVPTGTARNKAVNPSFETKNFGYSARENTSVGQSTSVKRRGTYSLAVTSLPSRTNLHPTPLHNVASTGLSGWYAHQNGVSIEQNGANLRLVSVGVSNQAEKARSCGGPKVNVVAGRKYRVAADFNASGNITAQGFRIAWYTAAGALIGSVARYAVSTSVGRKTTPLLTAPSGAATMRVYFFHDRKYATGQATSNHRAVMVVAEGESTTFFTPSDGADYFWTGTVNASPSVYHPPRDVRVPLTWASMNTSQHTASIYVRGGVSGREMRLETMDAGAAPYTNTVAGSWERISYTFTRSALPAPGAFDAHSLFVLIRVVPRGEYHHLDSFMVQQGSALNDFFDGSFSDDLENTYSWVGTANKSESTHTTYTTTGGGIPAAETPTADTLISSDKTKNEYNVGMFYTFSNELGETAGSQVTVTAVQRGWSMWRWETPNAAGEPSGTYSQDPETCADQLVAVVPAGAWNAAIAAGATHWNLYAFAWSNQEAVPVAAVQLGRRELTASSVRDNEGWLAMTPAQVDYSRDIRTIPSATVRDNYTIPSSGGQGLVASDRMVIVKDPAAAAVIRWTSNQQGSYTDFSAHKGGGYKTLTSGNLMVPACVKLWQNPQSVDTITILCLGTDGYSTGYYMAPAQIAQQSEATNIMGFEETTATPGTTSPYGCEVLNNALYHPLETELMKSTASNYNINHKSMTDQITNKWKALSNKIDIVSTTVDNRLYYLVYNPARDLKPGCKGNEVWVLDAAAEGGTWSRWLVDGVSLKRIEQGGKAVLCLSSDTGVYYFDETLSYDETVDDAGDEAEANIAWRLETNTQGANRAHDAWAHLQQVGLTLGNFTGTMRYGIRSWDLHGKSVNVSKVVRDLSDADAGGLPFDLEDALQVRRDLQQWYFYASSEVDDEGAVLPSSGQISLVQYRYTPVSVNVGYEYGSVETFEYRRASANWDQRTTDNGIPQPYIDVRRP